jgi:geranylgeranyl diphosphate synthase type II
LEFSEARKRYGALIEDALDAATAYPDHIPQIEVARAARYSLLGGGKRIRAMLVLAFCRLFGGDERAALPAACAVEMIHAYSLIHDDLPCMDNDELRRGKPTCHIQFGEAMALLAGDALLTGAFELLSSERTLSVLGDAKVVKLIGELSGAAGILGMIGGQVLDMDEEQDGKSLDALNLMHRLKTGALIRASVRMGCICAGAGDDKLGPATEYAGKIGLAFQITDDILDVIGNRELMGKAPGRDQKDRKSTYVTLLGVEEARRRADTLFADASNILSALNPRDRFLYDLTYFLSKRNS